GLRLAVRTPVVVFPTVFWLRRPSGSWTKLPTTAFVDVSLTDVSWFRAFQPYVFVPSVCTFPLPSYASVAPVHPVNSLASSDTAAPAASAGGNPILASTPVEPELMPVRFPFASYVYVSPPSDPLELLY